MLAIGIWAPADGSRHLDKGFYQRAEGEGQRAWRLGSGARGKGKAKNAALGGRKHGWRIA